MIFVMFPNYIFYWKMYLDAHMSKSTATENDVIWNLENFVVSFQIHFFQI